MALVEEPHLRVLDGCIPCLSSRSRAMRIGMKLSGWCEERLTGERLDYDLIYNGRSEWRLLPPIDHPDEPAAAWSPEPGSHIWAARATANRCMPWPTNEMTDSMKMFRWGRRRRPSGAGANRRRAGVVLQGQRRRCCGRTAAPRVPGYAEDGGEEAEIAGIYLIGPDGTPSSPGMAAAMSSRTTALRRRTI